MGAGRHRAAGQQVVARDEEAAQLLLAALAWLWL